MIRIQSIDTIAVPIIIQSKEHSDEYIKAVPFAIEESHGNPNSTILIVVIFKQKHETLIWLGLFFIYLFIFIFIIANLGVMSPNKHSH